MGGDINFPPPPDPPRTSFAIISRSFHRILQLTSALERGDNGGHDELYEKIHCIRERREMGGDLNFPPLPDPPPPPEESCDFLGIS